jgi:hypothetical protein
MIRIYRGAALFRTTHDVRALIFAERSMVAAATPPMTLTPAQRAKQDSEVQKTFRALGYIH